MSTQIGKWLRAEPFGHSASGITRVWLILSDDSAELGTVRWIARWRKYGFYPYGNTVYEQDCLRDIATFCEQRTTEHRQARKRLMEKS